MLTVDWRGRQPSERLGGFVFGACGPCEPGNLANLLLPPLNVQSVSTTKDNS